MTDDRRPGPPSDTAASDRSTAGSRVAELLVIEANQGDVRCLREVFADANIANTIHVVDTPDEALDFVYRRGEYVDAPRPDILLVDLHLLEAHGEATLDTFAGHPESSDVPVIVLTSSASEADRVRSIGIDVDAYVQKPIDPDTLLDHVREFDGFGITIVRDHTDALD